MVQARNAKRPAERAAKIILLFRRLEQKTGDESRLAALFSSDHARWATREIRTMTTYRDALRDFQSRWSDEATSPGGAPPAVADIGRIEVSPDPQRKSMQGRSRSRLKQDWMNRQVLPTGASPPGR